jgi:hypothetical protein
VKQIQVDGKWLRWWTYKTGRPVLTERQSEAENFNNDSVPSVVGHLRMALGPEPRIDVVDGPPSLYPGRPKGRKRRA